MRYPEELKRCTSPADKGSISLNVRILRTRLLKYAAANVGKRKPLEAFPFHDNHMMYFCLLEIVDQRTCLRKQQSAFKQSPDPTVVDHKVESLF